MNGKNESEPRPRRKSLLNKGYTDLVTIEFKFARKERQVLRETNGKTL